MIYKKIQGWFDFEDFYDFILSQFTNRTDNLIFVEIGVWKGKSTAFMAERLKQLGKLNISFYAIDTFEGSPNESLHKRDPQIDSLYNVACKNLFTLQQYVTLIRATSVEAATESYFDDFVEFVFIDATHTYEAVKQDIAAWLPKIKSGGIIAGHDYDWKGVARAVDELLPEKVLFKSNIWYYIIP